MAKQSDRNAVERRAEQQGRAVAYETALRGLMAAVRGMDLAKGSGWDAVVDALAAADAALVRGE